MTVYINYYFYQLAKGNGSENSTFLSIVKFPSQPTQQCRMFPTQPPVSACGPQQGQPDWVPCERHGPGVRRLAESAQAFILSGSSKPGGPFPRYVAGNSRYFSPKAVLSAAFPGFLLMNIFDIVLDFTCHRNPLRSNWLSHLFQLVMASMKLVRACLSAAPYCPGSRSPTEHADLQVIMGGSALLHWSAEDPQEGFPTNRLDFHLASLV